MNTIKCDLLVVIILALATIGCSGQRLVVMDSSDRQGKATALPIMTQTMLDQLGASLDVKYRLLTNFPEGCSRTGVDGDVLALR